MRSLALTIAFSALARALNVTIDDVDTAWAYAPAKDAWGAMSASNPCADCQSQPDPTQTMGGTWHDCSKDGTATLTFNGTAVTIYTICPGPHENDVYRGHFTFELDGKDTEQPFLERQLGCPHNIYNYPIYNVSGLRFAQHTLQISNHAGAARSSDLLIDYAVIDDGTPDPNAPPVPPAKKSLPVAAIVIPLLVIIAVILAGAFFFIRRRRQVAHERAIYTEPSPFKPPSLTSSIPMTAYVSSARPGHSSSRGPSFDSHSSGPTYDPELEAAMQIIAARSRSNASATTQSIHVMSNPSFSPDRKRRPTVDSQDDPFSSPPAYR